MAISSSLGSSALLPAGLGFRNVLINGDMRIAQRGTSSTTSSQAGFACDRWNNFRGSAVGGITVSRQTAGLTGFQYCSRIQRDSGNTATNAFYFVQNIESINSIPLAGKQVTLSFWARAGANYSASSNVLRSSVEYATSTDSNYYFIGDGSGTGVVSQNNTLTTTWQYFSMPALIPSSQTQLFVGFKFIPTGTAGAADYFEITGVQLEQNYQPTPFEQRPIGVELALCQRYYETSYDGVVKGTNTAVGIVYTSSSTDAYNSVVLPSALWHVPKRATPTVTVYSQAGTINKWNYSRSGVSDAEITVSSNGAYSSPRSALFYINTGAAFVSATGYGHFIADAEL